MGRRDALGLVVLLLGSLTLLGGCGGSGAQWQQFGASEGGFTVSMPGQPVKRQETLSTAVGPLHSSSYTVAPAQGVAYGVDYADYPVAVVQRYAPEAILDSARDALVAKVNGRVRSEQRISLSNSPGRELQLDVATGGFVRARIYLVGQRQYQVVAVTPDNKTASQDATTFLNSFKLLNR